MSNSHRARQAESVRSAVLPASMTCSCAVRILQNSPRGSVMPIVSSVAKLSGRAWMVTRPSAAARARASRTTRRMSSDVTARPSTGHCTLNKRDCGCPQERLT
jgi:hypothetical protein